jgi:hypothetical protein
MIMDDGGQPSRKEAVMRQRLLSTWLAVLSGAGLLLGCESGSGRRGLFDDPLLVAKKPAEGKVSDKAGAPPQMLARAEPTPPALPGTALATAPKPGSVDQPALVSAPTSTATPATNPSTKDAIGATPASRPGSSDVPTALAVRRQVPGTYGHAPDYSWLQGVLERHFDGHLNLRYCDPSIEDAHGGKVTLDDDQRLGQFKEGDTVQVEGELAPATASAGHGWDHYPHFHVRQVWAVTPGQ